MTDTYYPKSKMKYSTKSFTEMRDQFLKECWTEFRVELCLDTLVGGRPATPEMIEKWMNAVCKERSQEDRSKMINASKNLLPDRALLSDVVEDAEARSMTVFARHPKDRCLCLECRCLKAALKESANIVKPLVKDPTKKEEGNQGTNNLRSKVAERVFVVGDYAHILLNGKKIQEAPVESSEEKPKTNGIGVPLTEGAVLMDIPAEQRAIHVITQQGPRSALKKYEILRDVTVAFTVKILNDGVISEDQFRTILFYLENGGVGADRSQGFGQSQQQGTCCERIAA